MGLSPGGNGRDNLKLKPTVLRIHVQKWPGILIFFLFCWNKDRPRALLFNQMPVKKCFYKKTFAIISKFVALY